MNAVPAKIPEINAFLNFTRVLGIIIYVPAKKSHTSTNDEKSSKAEITGEGNLNGSRFWIVVDINTVIPLEQIIKIGSINKIAV
jgi:hypothetical protein